MARSRWLSPLLAGSILVAGAPSPAAGTYAEVVPPTGHGWIGAYINHEPSATVTDRMAQIDAAEQALGRVLDIDHHYRAFRDPLIGDLEAWDQERGRISLVSWHAVRTDRVVGGDFDHVIDQQARSVRDFGQPILLRWGWEMDMTRRWWVTSPEDYIAAWRRIVGRFRELGADNAAFVWCPTAAGFREGTAQAWYPGDAWVDWICADGYNWAPAPGPGWRSFERIFADFHAWASLRGKPLMVGEVGVQDDRAGSKAAWLREANEAIQERMPAIRALVYFDTEARYDWRTRPADGDAFEAWRDVVNDPYWAPGDGRSTDGVDGGDAGEPDVSTEVPPMPDGAVDRPVHTTPIRATASDDSRLVSSHPAHAPGTPAVELAHTGSRPGNVLDATTCSWTATHRTARCGSVVAILAVGHPEPVPLVREDRRMRMFKITPAHRGGP